MRTILIVEDERKLQDLTKRVLTRKGYEVLQAFDGAGLDSALAARKPSLIVLDAMLPDVHGLDLLDQVKTDPRTSSIPVLVWSGLAAEQERRRALALGAADFVEKGSPFALAAKIDVLFAEDGGSDSAA